jgi:hypothetical protein
VSSKLKRSAKPCDRRLSYWTQLAACVLPRVYGNLFSPDYSWLLSSPVKRPLIRFWACIKRFCRVCTIQILTQPHCGDSEEKGMFRYGKTSERTMPAFDTGFSGSIMGYGPSKMLRAGYCKKDIRPALKPRLLTELAVTYCGHERELCACVILVLPSCPKW